MFFKSFGHFKDFLLRILSCVLFWFGLFCLILEFESPSFWHVLIPFKKANSKIWFGPKQGVRTNCQILPSVVYIYFMKIWENLQNMKKLMFTILKLNFLGLWIMSVTFLLPTITFYDVYYIFMLHSHTCKLELNFWFITCV